MSLSRRLETIPGVGPLLRRPSSPASPIRYAFGSARDVPAWIGLVPKQNSTRRQGAGWEDPKRGNRYLRFAARGWCSYR